MRFLSRDRFLVDLSGQCAIFACMSENNKLAVYANTRKRENTLIRNVYGFMALGLALTSVVAYFASTSEAVLRYFLLNPVGSIVLVVAQLAVVFILSSRIERLSTTSAMLCFFGYSALTGISLSSIFIAYTSLTIWKAFLSTALMFVGMTVYATVTKRDVSSWSRYLVMGLWGLIIASFVNLLFGSTMIDLVISIVGIVVFMGLSIWDTRRIVEMNREYGSEMTYAEHTKLGIIGALNLYLDFLNIFLYLLRIYAAADRD